MHQVHGVRWTFQQAQRMLESSPGPTFLWIHIGAPHMPYFEVPDLPAGAPLEPERYSRIADRDFLTISHDPDGGTRRVRAAYEAYVRFADREFGQFVQSLETAGLWEDTMLVLTSDHGENMSPPNFGHGVGPLTSDQTHVPLLIRLPGQRDERRVDEFVSHLDILPTILEQVYQAPPGHLPGHSALAPALPRNRSVVAHGWFFHDKPNQRYGPLSSAVYQRGLAYTVNVTNGRDSLVDLEKRPLKRRAGQISGLRTHLETFTSRFGPLPSHPPEFGAVGRMDPKPDMAR
ncbi:MAG: sulfatase-like hydrolase/transferase [Candidatus Sericytochromatia bacterium]